MKNKRNILVLSAGRRVELVQSFQNALRRHFPGALVYATDMRPDLSAACQIADGSLAVPRATDPQYVDFLSEFCSQHGIGMVIPTIDTELRVMAGSRERFLSEGVHVIVSGAALVSVCRDKRKTANVFDELGIAQPAIYDRNAIRFPCFCKPFDGSCSVGARPLHTVDMLSPELLANEKNMFMELVGSEYSEYTIDAYYNRAGQLCCLVPRERIEVRGGEVSKGATRKHFVYDYLLPRLRRMPDARGCITVQVFANPDSKDIKALEINPRFGGGYPLSHAAGADYPDWLVREYFLGEEITFMDSWESNLLMLRYDAKVIVHDV